MGLEIVDDTEMVPLGPSKDGTYEEANGGTELMNRALYERVDRALLDEFFIIKSRVRDLDLRKKNILWLHDLWRDPEVQHLKDERSRSRFSRLVFVSNHQFVGYNLGLGVPFHESMVLRNAIEPIEWKEKEKYEIRLIYHTTPHRGLQILVPVMQKLSEIWGDRIHLDVYSSFEAYGWKERDEPYLDLFKQVAEHPNMTYHGFQPNDVIRKALQEAHIFAYPSIWEETSCIAAIEAMSAGCEIVCPNYGALPETTGNFATMYQFSEDMQYHANVFANVLNMSIQNHFDEANEKKRLYMKNWADNFYNWDMRANEWTGLLQGLSQSS